MHKLIFARKIFPYLPEKCSNKWRFLYICKNSSPMSDYKPRIADALLKRKLAGKGAILIRFSYLPWRLAQCRWNGPWYCSRTCIWLLRRDGRYGLIEIKLGGEALVPYGTYRCRQHCIQTPRGWHLCRSDRLSETLIGFKDTGEINWCSHLYHGADRPVHIMKLDYALENNGDE